MNIGILTLPFNNNYGGLLQAYALMEFLKRRGHKVYIIKRVPNRHYTIRAIYWYFRNFRNNFVSKNMKQFEDEKLLQTTKISSDKDFKLLNSYELDAIFVGSDQIWRFDYTKERKMNYFLDFAADNIKKIAFSASLGIDKWTLDSSETEKINKLLSKFDFISVREESGVKLLNELFECDVQLILDPTLLLDKFDYMKLFNKNDIANIGKIFVYYLDSTPKKMLLARELSKKLNKDLFFLNRSTRILFRTHNKVSNWLKAFHDASFVITDSFHGCVFSIIFQKPFYVIGNNKRGNSRFDSLLKIFRLEERLLIDDLPKKNSLKLIIDDEIIRKNKHFVDMMLKKQNL